MRTSWLKQNCIGLLMLVSIVLLFSIIFIGHGRISVTTYKILEGGERSVSISYRQDWGMLGNLIPIAIFFCFVSMYIGKAIHQSKLKDGYSQSRVFIPAFAGLTIIALLDMGAYVCFNSLFYFVLASIVSISMIIILGTKLKKFQRTLLIVVIVLVAGLVCFVSIGIYVACPLALLSYLLFALILSLPLFALVRVPFSKLSHFLGG